MFKYFLIFSLSVYSNFLLAQNETMHSGTVFLSKDLGKTWQPADEGLPPSAIINAIMEIRGLVLVATENHGIYGSTDELQSWHSFNYGLDEKKVDALVAYKGGAFAGTYKRGIFKSDDGGLTWYPFNTGLSNFTVRAFFVYHNNLLAGTNDGIFLLDGNNWRQLNSDFQVNDFGQMDDKLFVATNKGVLISKSAMDDWEMILKHTAFRTLVVADNLVFGQTYFSEWVRADVNGLTLADLFFTIPKPVINCMVRIDDYILAQMQTGFYRSYDEGKTWRKMENCDIDGNRMKMIRDTKLGLIAIVGEGGC